MLLKTSRWDHSSKKQHHIHVLCKMIKPTCIYCWSCRPTVRRCWSLFRVVLSILVSQWVSQSVPSPMAVLLHWRVLIVKAHAFPTTKFEKSKRIRISRQGNEWINAASLTLSCGEIVVHEGIVGWWYKYDNYRTSGNTVWLLLRANKRMCFCVKQGGSEGSRENRIE